MLHGPAQCLGPVEKPVVPLVEDVSAECLPNVFDGRFGRMHHVPLIETVVAQVVHQDFVGREIAALGQAFRQCVRGQNQRRLAQRVLGRSVAQMTYRTDGEDRFSAGQEPGDRFAEGFDDFACAHSPTAEHRCGQFVAIRHDPARVAQFVYPGRAQRENGVVGRAERFGAGFESLVDPA